MFPGMSPYSYAANNPFKYIDPDGKAWKPITEKIDGIVQDTGYEWISESRSYNKDGNLKKGLYHQAVFFIEHKNFKSKKHGYNIGSATAYVYKGGGTFATFMARTFPSDTVKYLTVPDLRLEAKLGLHKGNYNALRMADIGTKNFDYNKISLDFKNPNTGKTFGLGVNIHKAGIKNFTGMYGPDNEKAVSKGCFLIDRNKYQEFINIFSNEKYKNSMISIIKSQTLSSPKGFHVF